MKISGFDQQQQRRRGSLALQDEDPLTLPSLSRRRVSDGVEPTAPPVPPASPASLPHQHSAPSEVPAPSAERPQQPLLPVVIQWKKGGRDVQLCGSFTGWKPIPMARSESNINSEHMSIVNLPEGRHEYKFRIDGQWVVDTSEPTADTDDGDKTNYIDVKGSDFAACEALNLETAPAAGDLSGSPPGSYGREPPPSRAAAWESRAASQPPALPPHLLQVILNKDTPVSCEPTLLPAPNHVMLNHLYALSIKDGVMVLSATHRYRKKYVTTLLYKPI
ncbi:5'-AMP-activated protein kinase subunit beta-1 [Amphibalanus amphitrite]|uniref:5'-AMP-activated protein kinase subunit beta-1 n=1 Tax=Amphibalanus amphitrite TaxID=1232801 RepID=A0A6A4WMI8_AMPAM|nr:5'-AMP-activated protein kinase subunit beta-1 [Amphibalanus amphitrite]